MARPEQAQKPENNLPSKFEEIKKKLISNSNVFYAGGINTEEFNNFFDLTQLNSETYTAIVSPITPVFAVKKLNLFMNNLVSELPTEKLEFRLAPNGDLLLGKIIFKEKIDSAIKIMEINIYPNPDISKFMVEFENTPEQGSEVCIRVEEALEKDGNNTLWVDAYDLRTKIDKKLLKVLKRHEKAFSEETLI